VDEGHKAGGDVLILTGTHKAADVADKKSTICMYSGVVEYNRAHCRIGYPDFILPCY
jgi:hypothetical protein